MSYWPDVVLKKIPSNKRLVCSRRDLLCVSNMAYHIRQLYSSVCRLYCPFLAPAMEWLERAWSFLYLPDHDRLPLYYFPMVW